MHNHLRVLGTKLLEKVIADTSARPDLRDLVQPDKDSWSLKFPNLTALGLDGKPSTDISICISTEDIVGPVRNGGIGTTYSFLAKLLAAEGFRVTILYLRGDYVEIGEIDHWIAHYASFGVKFLCVEDFYTRENGAGNSDRWTGPMYNMFRHLQTTHYDIVHVSEWRGSGYFSLLAKRQRVAFEKTHFVVKCSSPWLWNRLYGSHPLKNIGELDKIHAEQKSVELGDHIIGGSAHLLRWMASQGYELAHDRTFVQPNIISTADLDPIVADRANAPGQLIPVEEIVFFGRLEGRKGVDVFCDAIDSLLRRGISLPAKISFMGKPGSRLETRPDLNSLEFIERATESWPVDVQILTEFQQEQALRYLLGGNRLAIMPSIIENSSLAVYEAVICGIPFIASNSGGTPELIDAAWHSDVLCDAHPYALALQLEKAIAQGGRVAAASFDNAQNTQTWLQYHKTFSKWHKPEHAALQVRDLPCVTVIIPHRDQLDDLKVTLAALESCGYPNLMVHVIDDGSYQTHILAELDLLHRKFAQRNWRFSSTPGIETSLSANLAAENDTSEFLYFTRPGHAILPGAMERLVKVAIARNLGGTMGFSLEYVGKQPPSDPTKAAKLHMPILGNPAYTMLSSPDWHWDLLVRREAFDAIGGFTGDFRQVNEEKELCHVMEMKGWRTETVPLPSTWFKLPAAEALASQRYNMRASAIRPMRPAYRYGPLFFRNLMLLTFGISQQVDRLIEQNLKLKKDREVLRQQKLARKAQVDTLREKLVQLQSVPRQSLVSKGARPVDSANILESLANNNGITDSFAFPIKSASDDTPEWSFEDMNAREKELARKLKDRNNSLKEMREKRDALLERIAALRAKIKQSARNEITYHSKFTSTENELEKIKVKLRDRDAEVVRLKEMLNIDKRLAHRLRRFIGMGKAKK